MKNPKGSLVGLIAAPVLWGGNFLAGDVLADSLPGLWANLLRWIIALIVLAPFCIGTVWTNRVVLLRHVRTIAPSAVLGITLFNSLLYTALSLAPVNLAAVTFAVAPFMILVLAAMVRRRLPGPREIAVSSIAMVAIGLLQMDALRHGVPVLGIALVLAAALTWAGYCMAVQRLSVPAPAVAVYFVQIVIGTILLAPIAVLSGWPNLTAMGASDWACVAFIGVFPGAIAFWLWQGAIRQVGAETAGVFMNLVPLTSILIGATMADVQVTYADTLYCVMIFLGLYVARPRSVVRSRINICLTSMRIELLRDKRMPRSAGPAE